MRTDVGLKPSLFSGSPQSPLGFVGKGEAYAVIVALSPVIMFNHEVRFDAVPSEHRSLFILQCIYFTFIFFFFLFSLFLFFKLFCVFSSFFKDFEHFFSRIHLYNLFSNKKITLLLFQKLRVGTNNHIRFHQLFYTTFFQLK